MSSYHLGPISYDYELSVHGMKRFPGAGQHPLNDIDLSVSVRGALLLDFRFRFLFSMENTWLLLFRFISKPTGYLVMEDERKAGTSTVRQ